MIRTIKNCAILGPGELDYLSEIVLGLVIVATIKNYVAEIIIEFRDLNEP